MRNKRDRSREYAACRSKMDLIDAVREVLGLEPLSAFKGRAGRDNIAIRWRASATRKKAS